MHVSLGVARKCLATTEIAEQISKSACPAQYEPKAKAYLLQCLTALEHGRMPRLPGRSGKGAILSSF